MLYREHDLPRLAASLAPHIRVGDVIGLSGDLGMGKTSLARALLRALGADGDIPSPSFAIVQPYYPPEVRLTLHHYDLYRLADPSELAELALAEARAEGALLIEWPDRLGALWVDEILHLHIESAPDDAQNNPQRRLTARVPQAWESRWPFR